MNTLSLALISCVLILLASPNAVCADVSEIETKYLMFKLPIVRVDGLDRLTENQKNKVQLGKNAFLEASNAELIAASGNSSSSRTFLVKTAIKVESVTLHPGCKLLFTPTSDKRYELFVIDCEEGSIEYENVRVKANFSSYDAPTFNQFYASELTADSKIPLPNGKFLYPGDKINVVEWVAIAPTNLFKLEKK